MTAMICGGFVVAAVTISSDREHLGVTVNAVSVAAAADSSWLIPLLFGIVLAVLAVTAGQSFTGVAAAQADVNRRRLAVLCWVVAGIGVADAGLVLSGGGRAHAWAVVVSVTLLVVAALWVGTVVFGPPEQQLRVLSHTLDDLYASMDALPMSALRPRPIRLLLRAASFLGLFSMAVSVGVAVWVGTGVPWVVASLALAAPSAAAGGVQAALCAYLRDAPKRSWAGIVPAWVYLVAASASPVGLAVSGSLPRGAALVVASAYITPMLVAVATPRSVRWSVRAAVDAIRADFLIRRSRAVRDEQRRLRALLAVVSS
ncbi:hypothetical protein [Curtobacterium sp. UNCCL17]|uniref:hypothetical protein n=1 Tax=Curtobacterium sp. UNCCL17 TaxID=1449051 RepID=UPI000483CE28|nr:hypothetical protein [Curtobacterium sp. UNCCL17]